MDKLQSLTRSDLNFFINQNVQVDLQNFIVSLLCAAILSFLVQLFYIKYSSTLSNRKEFSKNFVILGVTTCIVIMIVKSSLALSLGLVGALSIVRFRAAIKEPGELVYLFLIIAAGIGCGSGQIKITVLGILFSLLAIVFSSKILKQKINSGKQSFNLLITIPYDQNLNLNINEINKDIKKIISNYEFISIHKSSDEIILNYDIEIEISENINDIYKELNKKFTNSNISFSKNDYLPA